MRISSSKTEKSRYAPAPVNSNVNEPSHMRGSRVDTIVDHYERVHIKHAIPTQTTYGYFS